MCNVCIPSFCGNIVDCTVHIRYVYRHTCLICAHEIIGICSISIAFEGHICYWHIHGYSMEDINVGSTCPEKLLTLNCIFIMPQCYPSFFTDLRCGCSVSHLQNRLMNLTQSLNTIEQIRWHEHISNAEVCMWTQQLPVCSLITKCRLHWFGHLLHCFPDPTLTIYHFDPSKAGWRRPSGAPHTH